MALVSKPPGIVPVRTWGFQSPARPCGIVGKEEIPEAGPAGRKPHWYNRPAINPRWVVPLAEAEELAVASLAPPTKAQSSQAPAELFRMHCLIFSSLIFPLLVLAFCDFPLWLVSSGRSQVYCANFRSLLRESFERSLVMGSQGPMPKHSESGASL